jgi:hypothetical protein
LLPGSVCLSLGRDVKRLIRVKPGVALDDLGDVLLFLQPGAHEPPLGVHFVVGVAQPAHDLVVGHRAHDRCVQLYHWSR